ncbi:MAG: adenosylcobinamide-GDP ribazoletransferase [Anaerolineaceae bacterium]|nr:adenosylcobinamide-GDP ribazoletransferase [Anaerolineaceae bacterium]
MKLFLIAISFLTIIPVSRNLDYKKGDLGRSAVWFPFIGVLIGGIAALTFWLTSLVLSDLLAAFLSVLIWIFLTGGLHLDGLGDCCDALLSSLSRERRLEILKDPRMGAFGTLGLILAVIFKVLLLADLVSFKGFLLIPFAAGMARWIVILLAKTSPPNEDGLSNDFSSRIQVGAMLIALLPLVSLTIFIPWPALAGSILALLGLIVIRQAALKTLELINGDVMGLVIEVSELLILFAGYIALQIIN